MGDFKGHPMLKIVLIVFLCSGLHAFNLTRLSHSEIGGARLNHITAVAVIDNVVYAPNYGYLSSQNLDPNDPSAYQAGTNFTSGGTAHQFNITSHGKSIIVSTRHGGALFYDISDSFKSRPTFRYQIDKENTSFED